MYYTYMLRCKDNSIYTGIASDINKRMKEHFEKDKKCAKYTQSHDAKKLEAVWESNSRILASKLEYRIKTLNKMQKEKLIVNQNLLREYFIDKLEVDEYNPINIDLKF